MFYIAIKEKMKQIINTILMIQPVAFRYNEQTAINNYYQKVLDGLSSDQIQKNCLLYTSPSPRDVEESRMPSSA